MTKTKICFIGLDNYPVLNPNLEGKHTIGGESVQQVLLAKAFSQLGYEASMLCFDYGQPQREKIDGITVHKTYRPQEGLPGLRFVHPRLTVILKYLKEADADIYYQSRAGVMTGYGAWFCRRHGRKYIFRTAHDTDCIPGQQLIRIWRDRKIYEYGLKRAQFLAAQSEYQKRLLKDNYGLDSQVIDMAVEPPAKTSDQPQNIDVLWVNNLRPIKKAEVVLDVARLAPRINFTMIGGPTGGSDEYYEKVRQEARSVNNIDFVGPVPYHLVHDYFDRAKLFLNTSGTGGEGFPNTFLQAWIRGVPVISFFNPDGLLDREGIGVVPGDVEDMAREIGRLVGDDGERGALGERARQYSHSRYSAVSVARNYVELFNL